MLQPKRDGPKPCGWLSMVRAIAVGRGDSPPVSKWVFRGLGLFGPLAGKVRIEGSLGLKHGASNADEAIGNRSERAAVAAGAKGRVFRLASRVVLHGDAGQW